MFPTMFSICDLGRAIPGPHPLITVVFTVKGVKITIRQTVIKVPNLPVNPPLLNFIVPGALVALQEILLGPAAEGQSMNLVKMILTGTIYGFQA